MKQIQQHPKVRTHPATRFSVYSCLLLLFPVFLWSGCKQEAKVVASADSAGTYTLVSVDGKQVPCTVAHEGASPMIKSGNFVINSNGTCSSKMVFSVPPGGDATREIMATFTRDGSILTMRWEGAGTTTGSVQGDTFTMNNEGMLLAYRK
jgi:hypothetical protein